MELIAAPMASSGGSGITLLLPLILIVGMIWFMSRTQRKQRQRQADTVAALSARRLGASTPPIRKASHAALLIFGVEEGVGEGCALRD